MLHSAPIGWAVSTPAFEWGGVELQRFTVLLKGGCQSLDHEPLPSCRRDSAGRVVFGQPGRHRDQLALLLLWFTAESDLPALRQTKCITGKMGSVFLSESFDKRPRFSTLRSTG